MSSSHKIENRQEIKEVMEATKPALRFGLIIVAVSILLFGVWAGFAPLDSAAVASGSIVLDSNRKTIQHLEGGIITEMLVKDGDSVVEGQDLVKLNSANAGARQDLLMGQLRAEKATELRLIAERDGKNEVLFDDEMFKNKSDPKIAKVLDSQFRLFETKYKSLLGQVDVLQQRIAQLNSQIEGYEAQKKATENQLVLIREEVEAAETLLEKGLGTKPRVLQLKRRAEELEGQKGEYIAEIAKVKESIGENELQIINIKNEHMKEVVAELKETQQKIADLTEQLHSSEDVLTRTVIKAPQSGVVTGSKFHTIGGVISPGTPIMDIVPQDDNLVVEARVLPIDIDVVHEGLKAKVILSAYKARFVPRLEGEVIRVSADKFVDEHSGDSYYLARVRISEEEIKQLDKDINLYPGMPAEVFIVTGSRTLLDYLLSPITESMNRAFREE